MCRDRLDADTYGGAALLGLDGSVVIAHGASTARAVSSACALAANLARGDITESIRERLGATGERRGAHFRRRDRERLFAESHISHSIDFMTWRIHSRFSAPGCVTRSARRSVRTSPTRTR